MEWLVILALGVWVWWQDRRTGELMRQIDSLERGLDDMARRIAAITDAGASAQTPPRPEPEPPTPEAQARAASNGREPLLLDTPLPDVSNDSAAPLAPPPAPSPAPEPVLLLTDVVRDDNGDAPMPFPPAAATPPPRVTLRRRRFEQWLAENGLAWLAGVVLAFAGIFLVSFMGRQGWFTPPVQLGAAVALGFLFIGGGEWTRRLSARRPPGHPLLAASLAGAGVVVLYACSWAAHAYFGFVGWGAGAVLLTLCAALLMGLSLLHGQALGVLAIGIGLLVPVFARGALWPPDAVTLYVGAVAAAGFAVAAFRRWAWVGAATLLGLYFWFTAAIAVEDVRRALMLASLAALGGVLIALRKPLAEEGPGQLTWRRAHEILPAASVCVSSVLLLWAWVLVAPMPQGGVAGPAWVSTMFTALAAGAVRWRAAHPAALAVSIGALVLGFLTYLSARGVTRPVDGAFYAFALFASGVVILSALFAHPHRRQRLLLAVAGAAGAALLTAVAATSREDWDHVSAWAALFMGAAALFAAAWQSARTAEAPRADKAVGAWTIAAAALAMLGVESAFPALGRSIAHAGLAALLAAGFVWRGWSMLRYAALTAAALAVAHALAPALIGAALAGTLPLASALAILAAAAALLLGASIVIARVEPRAIASEALSGASAIVVLIGVFLGLRWIAAGGAGAPLDGFTEASLGALTLLAAGHVLLPRRGQQTGLIGAWRGHVLMGLGLLYALVAPVTALNPWWGVAPEPVIGPPVLDTLALAFAAPAALALAAANRLYAHQRTAARIYGACGGVLVLVWAVLALRRAFHGEAMPAAEIGLLEGACYGLLSLAAALAVVWVARMRSAKDAARPLTQDLMAISKGCAWAGVVAAGLIMLLLRHPWWGAHYTVETGDVSTLLATLAQAAALGLALALGRALSRSPEVERTRFAAAAAAGLFGWSFGHAALRWLYHRGEMDDAAPLVGLEGFAHGLWPLAFVLGAAALTARAPHRDTMRPYLYDLQAIWANAVWPALGFAALGLWLWFNPWWGSEPAGAAAPLSALTILALFVLAAWLSAAALRVPHLRAPDWFARAATIAAAGHLFVAATFAVRRLFHAADVATAPVTRVEEWIYVPVWALFGAAAFWLGMRTNNVLRRWIGLFVLIGTTVYVFALAFSRLTGIAQIGSMLGLGAVLIAVTWFARSSREHAPADPLAVKPGARRDRRHGRRQRSP